MTGDKHPLYGIKGKDHHRFGTNHTKEAKIKISLAGIGRLGKKKLSDNDVLFIRKYYSLSNNKTNVDINFLKNKYNVSYGFIEGIIYNTIKCYKHIEIFNYKNRKFQKTKLTKELILEIRELAKTMRQKDICVKYNLKADIVNKIVLRKIWKDI